MLWTAAVRGAGPRCQTDVVSPRRTLRHASRASPTRGIGMARRGLRRAATEAQAHAEQADVAVLALPPADDQGRAARLPGALDGRGDGRAVGDRVGVRQVAHSAPADRKSTRLN